MYIPATWDSVEEGDKLIVRFPNDNEIKDWECTILNKDSWLISILFNEDNEVLEYTKPVFEREIQIKQ